MEKVDPFWYSDIKILIKLNSQSHSLCMNEMVVLEYTGYCTRLLVLILKQRIQFSLVFTVLLILYFVKSHILQEGNLERGWCLKCFCTLHNIVSFTKLHSESSPPVNAL